MNITVFGAGYVGLVTAAHLAYYGHEVVCIDQNENLVTDLNVGKLHIHEPGLESMVSEAIADGSLRFMSNLPTSPSPKIIIIAVGTPAINKAGDADLSQVYAAVETIGNWIESPAAVVIKSTVPVGTAQTVRVMLDRILDRRDKDFKVEVISNPEFLQEGKAVADVLDPYRIIIGSNNLDSPLVEKYVRIFYNNKDNIVLMDNASAELTKYAANAMLASRISFMNEMACFADKVGANIDKVREGMAKDPRIGPAFLEAGLGYGGSCLPKDLSSLMRQFISLNLSPVVLKGIQRANERAALTFVEALTKRFNHNLTGMKIAILGVAFKEGTNDVRESSAQKVIDVLREYQPDEYSLVLYDPRVSEEQLREVAQGYACANIAVAPHFKDAVKDADVLIFASKAFTFLQPNNFSHIKELMKTPIIFDGRNQFDPYSMEQLGFEYHSVGRLPVGEHHRH